MSPLSPIPQEVIDLVVDELSYDSNPHEILKICSLASRQFLPQCRKHLFSILALRVDTLGNIQTEKRCIRFLELAKRSPHILQYISQVDILADSCSPWISTYIPRIMQLVAQAEVLRIFGLAFTVNRGPVNWAVCGSDMTHALERLWKLESLESVRLGMVHHVPATLFLKLGPALKKLVLHVVGIDASASVQKFKDDVADANFASGRNGEECTAPLTHFDISGWDEILPFLLRIAERPHAPFTFSRLSSLAFCTSDGTKAIWKIAEAAAGSLETLNCRFPSWLPKPVLGAVDFSVLPKLERLFITIDVSAIEELCLRLAKIPIDNRLRKAQIRVECFGNRSWEDGSWGELDSALSCLQLLKEVEVIICLVAPSIEFHEDDARRVSETLEAVQVVRTEFKKLEKLERTRFLISYQERSSPSVR